jgi:hypothetical protein
MCVSINFAEATTRETLLHHTASSSWLCGVIVIILLLLASARWWCCLRVDVTDVALSNGDDEVSSREMLRTAGGQRTVATRAIAEVLVALLKGKGISKRAYMVTGRFISRFFSGTYDFRRKGEEE